MNLLLIGLLALVALASLTGQLLLSRRLKAVQAGAQEREQEQQRQLRQLSDDLAALCKASAGAGEHVVKLDQQLRRMVDRQDQWELRAGGERSYQQAIQMVHKGAGVEELVTNCGLTRGEADLIVMLHGMARAG